MIKKQRICTWKRTARLQCWPPRGESEIIAFMWQSMQVRDPHWLWNPEEMSAEVRNRGINAPAGRSHVLLKFKTKQNKQQKKQNLLALFSHTLVSTKVCLARLSEEPRAARARSAGTVGGMRTRPAILTVTVTRILHRNKTMSSVYIDREFPKSFIILNHPLSMNNLYHE